MRNIRSRLKAALLTAYPLDSDDEQRQMLKARLEPRRPMQQFEKATGLTSLNRNYQMPAGRSSKLVEIEFEIMRHECALIYDNNNGKFRFMYPELKDKQDAYLSYAAQLIKELYRLNPSLRSIAIDIKNPDHTVDFILGVTSGYLPEDIAYYVSKSADQSNFRKTPHIAELQNRLTRHYNGQVHVAGVLSPLTCCRIHGQLNEIFGPS